jgi:hypothetical protein
MKKQDTINIIIGIIIGMLLAFIAVVVKDEIRFYAECDGKVLSDWNGKNYCVDPSILDK